VTGLVFPHATPAESLSVWKAGRAYWACQIGGWSVICVLNLLGTMTITRFRWQYVFITFCISVLGIALTHVVRAKSRAARWLDLPPWQLLWRVALAMVAMAAATSFAVWVLDTATDTVFEKDEAVEAVEAQLNSKFAAHVVMHANLIALYGTWCALYYGIHFLQRKQHSEAERWKLQAALSAAELAALKAQLNPHFLFNALNGLRALIIEDAPRAQHVVTRLASMLRYSLQANTRETVPLGDELRTVDDYLELETIRFEDRLRIVRDISPDTFDAAVPPMVVQTLVENAIKYGVSRHPEVGEVRLSAQPSGDSIEIRVENTGTLGATAEGTGVGLRNAAERIHRLWGERASLRLTEEPAGRVVATLRVPR
jgi:LytS/YehU family sensor histidine kinase